MPETLLQTKLFVPPLRPNFVSRPHLIERLNQGLQLGHKLTLVSAPAGFGKTTLVGDWAGGLRADADNNSHIANRVAWLSLDEGDNDLTRFLTYLVAALQTLALGEVGTMAPKIGEGAVSMLQSPQSPPTEAILISLINDVTPIPDRIVLVLDDYHLIDSSPVDDALNFILDHLPPKMHLVIATRTDPDLPLARLRARGQLAELRAKELRFSSSESAEFLNRVMGLNLSTKDIAALETRTEGWIAGLQLAAISMQGSEDLEGFITSFAGSHRYVLDYLIEEVLERQPKSVQAFMLQTAILDRLTGSLCDAVTGQENGRDTLEMLERANLFIISLDDERRWYRYHHLFADLLQKRLRLFDKKQIPTLHIRASEWYEQNNFMSDAIHHALSAKDYKISANLLELEWRPMDSNYQSGTWLNWVKGLPDEVISTRPVLSAGYGWALLDAGELEASELRLRDAERWLGTTLDVKENHIGSSVKMVVVDKEEFYSLPGTIANARAYLAQAFGNGADTIKYAKLALDLLLEDDYFGRGISSILLGYAYWAGGDLAAARMAVADSVSNMQKADSIPYTISFTSYLAEIMIAQGCLHEAASTYKRALQLATEKGKPGFQETVVLHLGLSEILIEQGDLEAARHHLLKSRKLGEHPAFPPWHRHWFPAQARMMEVQGNLDGAIKMLKEAERQYYRYPIPVVRPLSALKSRLWVRQGKLVEAIGWVREQNLSVDDNLSYLREFEHITLARIVIAQYRSDHTDDAIRVAMGLLDRLLQAAEGGKRTGSVIEILLLKALVHEAKGEISTAILFLGEALTLAEPESYTCIFVDEGPPMARLLNEALNRGIASNYVRRLMATFSVDTPAQPESIASQADQSELFEPLSERELEVLKLIAEGLTNKAIASRLFLSQNTVKVHARNIHSKLGVHSRTQAVAKARALGILP